MYRYYVTTDRIAECVLAVKHLVADFMDYGMKIHVPGGIEAFGWVETVEPLPLNGADLHGL